MVWPRGRSPARGAHGCRPQPEPLTWLQRSPSKVGSTCVSHLHRSLPQQVLLPASHCHLRGRHDLDFCRVYTSASRTERAQESLDTRQRKQVTWAAASLEVPLPHARDTRLVVVIHDVGPGFGRGQDCKPPCSWAIMKDASRSHLAGAEAAIWVPGLRPPGMGAELQGLRHRLAQGRLSAGRLAHSGWHPCL